MTGVICAQIGEAEERGTGGTGGGYAAIGLMKHACREGSRVRGTNRVGSSEKTRHRGQQFTRSSEEGWFGEGYAMERGEGTFRPVTCS